MNALALICQTSPRPRGSLDSPTGPTTSALIDTFTACHLLAFGTDYEMDDYFSEIKDRLARDEPEEQGPIANLDDAEAALKSFRFDKPNAVSHYIALLGFRPRMEAAAGILVEAAIRAEATVLGFRDGSVDAEPIPPLRFVSMRWPLSFTHGFLRKNQNAMTEWVGLQWRRDDIEKVAMAVWHDLRPQVRTGAVAHDPRQESLAAWRQRILPAVLAEIKAEGLPLKQHALAARMADMENDDRSSRPRRLDAHKSWVKRTWATVESSWAALGGEAGGSGRDPNSSRLVPAPDPSNYTK